MSTILKAQVPGSQSPQPQMNKPIHTQGGPGPYGQPQNAPSQPSNQYSYQSGPAAAAQHTMQPVSYSPPKPQVYNQPYQNTMQPPQHIQAPSLPLQQNHQPMPEPVVQETKPHSNGTAEVNSTTVENHVSLPATPKKDVSGGAERTTVNNAAAAVVAEGPKVQSVVPTVTQATNISTATTASVAETPSNEASAKVNSSLAAKEPALEAKKEVKAKPVTNEVQEAPEKEAKKVENVQTVTTESSASSTKAKEEPASPQKSPIKVATPRTPTRKSKTPKSDSESPPNNSNKVKTPPVSEPKPSTSRSPAVKSKRQRLRTQPYQSPLPELEILSKMTPKKGQTESKLIVFYKNEHLAVRNSEGGFFICQAVQNIYKGSAKIKIRWLSQDKADSEIYTPDFYDTIDFDCILTNLNLSRVEKGRFKLPPKEKTRTDNILKRAIAVEKGENISLDDSLTEDNPDGLDVSLYKKEEQLVKKRKAAKRQASRSLSPHKSPKSPKTTPKSKKKSGGVATKAAASSSKRSPAKKVVGEITDVKRNTTGRAERAKRRTEGVVDVKKAKVLAKVVKRAAAGDFKRSSSKKKASKVKEKKLSQSEPSTSKGKTSKGQSKEKTGKKGKK